MHHANMSMPQGFLSVNSQGIEPATRQPQADNCVSMAPLGLVSFQAYVPCATSCPTNCSLPESSVMSMRAMRPPKQQPWADDRMDMAPGGLVSSQASLCAMCHMFPKYYGRSCS